MRYVVMLSGGIGSWASGVCRSGGIASRNAERVAVRVHVEKFNRAGDDGRDHEARVFDPVGLGACPQRDSFGFLGRISLDGCGIALSQRLGVNADDGVSRHDSDLDYVTDLLNHHEIRRSCHAPEGASIQAVSDKRLNRCEAIGRLGPVCSADVEGQENVGTETGEGLFAHANNIRPAVSNVKGKRFDPPSPGDATLFALPEFRWDGEWTPRIMDTPTAKRFLGEYHYLGSTHAVWSIGIFAPDLIAVVSVGQPANRNGVASKFGLSRWKGNHEITRVCVHPNAPKNAASRAIALAGREYAHLGYDWLFSYSDTGRGHHGGIYQAVNATYVGLSPGRTAWLLDGRPIHVRTLANRHGCDGRKLADLLLSRGHNLVRVPGGNAPKHTYILPIGTPSVRRAIRRSLVDAGHAMPYPKRHSIVEAA